MYTVGPITIGGTGAGLATATLAATGVNSLSIGMGGAILLITGAVLVRAGSMKRRRDK
ncbi:hypothetical protein GCM10010174_17890 [Kutzneria viridogrisea]|uniref:Uncharacterized protein n=2 Tax=Kutzneria TaxID=43356 RepID=W5WGD8_9PSEU|nr:hypothetical protein [Kutzneria albida]AHH99636.1 hypothetical protein KALB_6276 [Kutzneria albida DSM 43870]MBA8922808.1 hypothetical protein [Kutzneria viridogrisea]